MVQVRVGADLLAIRYRSVFPLLSPSCLCRGRLQAQLAGRTRLADFGSPDIAAHRGEASVPSVAHDFLIRDTVAVSKRSSQSRRAGRAG